MQLDATAKLIQELPKLLPVYPLLPCAGDLAVPWLLWTPFSALIWAGVGERGLPFQQHPTGRDKDKLCPSTWMKGVLPSLLLSYSIYF